ncbi:MAG: cobalt transporter CbiM [Thermodesulfobacteriota bacterium]
MHIPDGYLSPGTCLAFYGAMVPAWYIAARKVEKALRLSRVPLLALASAFTFVVMMFNIPVPGGTTGHMVGAAVVASTLGPWAGVLCLTLALTLQAFVFADGGITTLGANCFNMALVMSFSGYLVFRAGTLGAPGGARRFVAAAAAGYVSVNLAALAVGLELGLQPLLASSPEGLPLYSPFPLALAVPAMAASHLLFFGPVEALGTALVVRYVHAMGLPGLDRPPGGGGGGGGGGVRPPAGLRPLWLALAVLIVLTPLGLLASSAAWGEWSAGELKGIVGFIPEGMKGGGGGWGAWKGLMPGYSLPWAEGPVGKAAFYAAAAFVGSAIAVAAVYLLAGRQKRWTG